jgi:uncharacterized protein (TIGR02145 family)
MADTTYILNQEYPEGIPGFEQYQDSDKNLLTSFSLNSLFDPTKNFVELHIVDLADNLLESHYTYSRYTLSANAASAGKEGASVLTVDPIQDSLNYGYSFGGVKLLYHFLNDLYTSDVSTLEFYVDSISPDRTELSLLTNNLTPEEVVKYTDSIKSKLITQSYFNEFRLDFKDNNLFIGVNIDTLDVENGKSVVVKLYEPLPDTFKVKSTLNIVETVSDSVAYEVDYALSEPEVVVPTLRSANFNIDIQDENIIPTQYFNYDQLLSYKVNNTNSEIYSMINEKGVELSIDYTDYSKFVHFSSAQERLLNFKYKVDLLTTYSQSLSVASTVTGGLQGVSGSRTYYENLYEGIINNFDHYERFLYYSSGSSSWPKSNNAKPYINLPSSNQTALTWFNNALIDSVAYDNSNYNALVETVPTYLRDDASNENYLTFIHMVGQHFDNLWVYGEAVTDKYDNDNRPDFGISKDLVGEALKNFGIKLYTSNKSTEDLFSTFIGQAYQSGSEKINQYVTGSLTGSNAPIQPSSFDNYQKEVQKRIYHNLPLLLKSKGTERGLRALINCFGIPADILDIKLYGGRNINERPFYGDYQNYTSSLDKVRLDNTGSLVSGSTLSNSVSIIKRDDKYTDDLHVIEVGFSPTDNVDNFIRLGVQLPSVTIGSQVWTSDNLNITAYSDGTPIPQVTDGSAWQSATTGAWCYFNNNSVTGSTYQKLYNWYAVAGIYNAASLANPSLRKQFAPAGWHVPTATEWTTLSTYLGGDAIAGGKMKEAGLAHWYSPNTEATNETGFTGLPGGARLNGTFEDFGYDGYWWSSTEYSSTRANLRQLRSIDSGLLLDNLFKSDGLSIRLIQDTVTPNTFNIDNYLGDPGNLSLDNYSGLDAIAQSVLGGSLGTFNQYNLQDYVRLIKFFDNTVFKMIKDFIPARAVADTGIIIKPNLLNRSKAKSVILSGSRPEYTGSIDTAFISSSNGGSFVTSLGESITAYTDEVQTPTGILETGGHSREEARLNGELNGSELTLSTVDLNIANPYKDITVQPNYFNVNFVSSSTEVCLLTLKPGNTTPKYITSSTEVYYDTDFFQGIGSNVTYTTDQGSTPGTYIRSILFPRVFGSAVGSGASFNIKATNTPTCIQVAPVMFATCSLIPTQYASSLTTVSTSPTTYNFDQWWNIHPDQLTPGNMVIIVSWSIGGVPQTGQLVVRPNTDWYNFVFTQPEGTEVTVRLMDWRLQAECMSVKKVTVAGVCNLASVTTTDTTGFQFITSAVASIPALGVGNRYFRWLGRRYTSGEATNSDASNNPGLQSYFLPYPQPTSTRYIVYKIYRTTPENVGLNDFRGEVYITRSAPFGSINPNTFNSEADGTPVIGTTTSALWTPVNLNPRSIGINTDDRNYLNGTGTDTIQYSNSDLTRVYAYVVKAYSPSAGVNPTALTGCVQTVTIYRSYTPSRGVPTLRPFYATIPITWATNLDGTPIVGNNIEYLQMQIRTNPL